MENSTPPNVSSFQKPASYALEKTYTIIPLLTKVYVWLPLLLLTYVIYTRYLTGISHIPGPFSASISNWWKISAAWHEEMPQRNIALHRKYGSLVRIGPNMISVDDPAALNIIYGFKPIYLKVRREWCIFPRPS